MYNFNSSGIVSCSIMSNLLFFLDYFRGPAEGRGKRGQHQHCGSPTCYTRMHYHQHNHAPTPRDKIWLHTSVCRRQLQVLYQCWHPKGRLRGPSWPKGMGHPGIRAGGVWNAGVLEESETAVPSGPDTKWSVAGTNGAAVQDDGHRQQHSWRGR